MSLHAYQLSYQRGDRELFNNINFELHPGEALWLTGHNGSGKTSLLRLLCGLTPPLSGEIHWQGKNIQTLREDYFQDLIYFSHASGVKDDLTAWENVSMTAKISGKKCNEEAAYSALNLIGLADVAHLPARVLSQGQRKRVALASLCIPSLPKLLILDEPFTALDHSSVNTLTDILNQHLQRDGMVVYTTHQELSLDARQLHLLNLDKKICFQH